MGFPGIFSSIDAYTKNIVERYFQKNGKLYSWLGEIGEVKLIVSIKPSDFKPDEQYSIIDGYHDNKPAFFIKIIESIDKQIKAKNTCILVMCRAGISRSSTITTLYLFYSHKFKTFDEPLNM